MIHHNLFYVNGDFCQHRPRNSDFRGGEGKGRELNEPLLSLLAAQKARS